MVFIFILMVSKMILKICQVNHKNIFILMISKIILKIYHVNHKNITWIYKEINYSSNHFLLERESPVFKEWLNRLGITHHKADVTSLNLPSARVGMLQKKKKKKRKKEREGVWEKDTRKHSLSCPHMNPLRKGNVFSTWPIVTSISTLCSYIIKNIYIYILYISHKADVTGSNLSFACVGT